MYRPLIRSPIGDINRGVGQKLAEVRKHYCLEQAMISTYLGVSVVEYQHYESGTKRISTAYLHRLAQLYGRHVRDFLPARPKTQNHPRR